MSATFIAADVSTLKRPPRLTEAERTDFSWQQISSELGELPDGGFNIAHAAVDRHAAGPRASHTALRLLGADTQTREVSYGELARLSNRFANVLNQLGIQREERVFILCGRRLELYVALLGSLKAGAVAAPLFAAFGPDPIATRINLGHGAVLVTTECLYRLKIEPYLAQMPMLRHVLLINEDGEPKGLAGAQSLQGLLDVAGDTFQCVPTQPDSPALLHFTSGTTGTPKGALHVHGAALMHYMTGKYALDLYPDDVFWCTADPGWVTGTSYGILAPLLHGVTMVVDEQEFDAERWYRILAEQQVSVWYTAPTAIRMLMKAGPQLARSRSYPALRLIASVGEPLNPEAVWWGKKVLGLAIHDNWWQTETGGIMIANTPSCPIKPGSMGLPLPGVAAAVVERHDDDSITLLEQPDTVGELALKRGWPSMFRAYLGQDERYRRCFAGDWYLTGDLVRRDADGYYWFVSRSDDVIKSAGHLIGPFEVESALLEHWAVAEAGVIGLPDPISGEMVKAFVALKRAYLPSEALRRELLGHARKRLGAAVAPKEIAFIDSLPRTRSGKIMRRLLKARELGLPEGDLSTLESCA